jgi:pimeloyl-ACP methyl ester carboxylesterase
MFHALAQNGLRELFRRAWRGLHSVAAGLAFPLGGWWLGASRHLFDPARLTHGLVIVLPGIEGWGPLNWSIARGLHDGGFPGAILVHDWTSGLWPLFAFHLRDRRRNLRRAAELAQLIVDYRKRYAGRPVHLVGHSGGAALAVWTLEALPEGHSISSAVLLGPALSPSYCLTAALRRAEQGIWSFWSPLDLLFLAAGTFLVGTADGQYAVSAGFRGFVAPHGAGEGDQVWYRERLRQQCYRPRMLGQFHWGGHFGWANRVFVAEEVAPLLREGDLRGTA